MSIEWTDQTGKIDELHPVNNDSGVVETQLSGVITKGGRGLLISANVTMIVNMPAFTPELEHDIWKSGF